MSDLGWGFCFELPPIILKKTDGYQKKISVLSEALETVSKLEELSVPASLSCRTEEELPKLTSSCVKCVCRMYVSKK